jgi:FixJ family two-component response regulator
LDGHVDLGAYISARDGVQPGSTVIDRRATLVVVEDDEDVQRALTRFLGLHGYGVRAFDSAEAWLAGNCPADVAIVDINLPDMSGFELDERLRREGRAIPTVFITAQDELGPAPASRIILQKPLDPQSLLDAIEHILATRDGPPVAGDPS